MEVIKDFVAPLIGAIGGLFGIGAMLYAWLTGRSKSNAADIKALAELFDYQKKDVAEDLKKHDRRIQKVEDDLNHLPTKDQLYDLNLGLVRLSGVVDTLTERVESIARIVLVVDETLRRPESESTRSTGK